MKRFASRQMSGAFALVLATIFLLEGCLHTSRINTDPPGAQVTLNGAPLGKTPVYYSSRSGVPRTYFLEIEKPGYQRVETKVESQYRADISLVLLLPGIIPYFFSARLEDEYKYPLLSENEKGRR